MLRKEQKQKEVLVVFSKLYDQYLSCKLDWNDFKNNAQYKGALEVQFLLQEMRRNPVFLKVILETIGAGIKQKDPYAENAADLFDSLLKDGIYDNSVIKAFESDYMLEMLKRQPLKICLINALENYQLTQDRIKALLEWHTHKNQTIKDNSNKNGDDNGHGISNLETENPVSQLKDTIGCSNKEEKSAFSYSGISNQENSTMEILLKLEKNPIVNKVFIEGDHGDINSSIACATNVEVEDAELILKHMKMIAKKGIFNEVTVKGNSGNIDCGILNLDFKKCSFK